MSQKQEKNIISSTSANNTSTGNNPVDDLENDIDNDAYLESLNDCQLILDLSADNKENGLRSRKKEDLWHQFNDIPLGRTCPIKTAISRLLIHATFVFCTEDYDIVTEFLAATENIQDFMDHFYWNRES